jgi:hypothetical protein
VTLQQQASRRYLHVMPCKGDVHGCFLQALSPLQAVRRPCSTPCMNYLLCVVCCRMMTQTCWLAFWLMMIMMTAMSRLTQLHHTKHVGVLHADTPQAMQHTRCMQPS